MRVGPLHTIDEVAEGNEAMEKRERQEGITPGQAKGQTQRWQPLQPNLERVNEAARRSGQTRFTGLLHHVDVGALERAFRRQRRAASPGVDRVTVEDYERNLEANLQRLHERVHSGQYWPKPVRRTYIPKADGSLRPLGIPTLEDKIVQGAVAEVLNAVYEADFMGFSHGFRPQRSPHSALAALDKALMTQRVNFVLDVDIRTFLDTTSYCPPVHEVRSKSSGCRSIALIRSPFCLPRMTWTASSSPRLTRCNTVWRETPSAFIASRMGMKPSPASLLNRAMTSRVNRMRHGAPGVSCSPWMIPALSKRWRVEGATPSTGAAVLMVNSSPSACAALGSKHGISQCRRRLPTRPASKRWPYAVVRPWRLRMPAITASG